MRYLIIVGAGSAARDYLQFVKDINKVSPTFIIKGFIADSGVDIKKLTDGEYDILGTVDGWVPDQKSERAALSALSQKSARMQVWAVLSPWTATSGMTII